MNLPTKSAPVTHGQLTPEDADRFAAMFKPIWELDDAPFALVRPGALAGQDVQQLARAGVHADVQLASNGTAAAAGPHAPPASYHAPMPDGSIVLDIEPDLTPPPPQQRPVVPEHVQQVVHAQPQQQMHQHMHQQPVMQHPPQSARRRAPPPQVRAQFSDTGDFATVKKSNAALFVAIGVVALLAAAGIAYKVIGSNKVEEPTKPAVTTAVTREEPRIPPPPPVDTPAVTATTAAATDTIPPPVVTAPTVTAPPVVTTAAKPPPVVTTTVKPPVVTTTAKPKPTGKPGGIVRDNPF